MNLQPITPPGSTQINISTSQQEELNNKKPEIRHAVLKKILLILAVLFILILIPISFFMYIGNFEPDAPTRLTDCIRPTLDEKQQTASQIKNGQITLEEYCIKEADNVIIPDQCIEKVLQDYKIFPIYFKYISPYNKQRKAFIQNHNKLCIKYPSTIITE
jgi:hypothetical protein